MSHQRIRITNRAASAPARPGTRPAARTRGPNWFEIRNAVTGGTAEVFIYDEIGYWGVTAQDFARQLAALDVTDIQVRLNSPGGDAFDGIAIYNALRTHSASVTVVVDALAASAASIIAMAGDEIVMNVGSQMMIHDASGLCMGNASDMAEMVALLDRMSDNLAGIYAARVGGDAETWRDAMRAETWYTAEEAVAAGLADRTGDGASDDGKQMAAKWDLSVFQYAGRDSAPGPQTPGGGPVADPVRPRLRSSRPAARTPGAAPPALAPETEPSAPPVFEFDPDLFRAVIEDTYTHAAAPPQTTPDSPEQTDDPFVFDATEFRNSVLAAVREAK